MRRGRGNAPIAPLIRRDDSWRNTLRYSAFDCSHSDATEIRMQTITLWRPVGPEELALIRASGMREFPPRLPDQPIFYPVTSEEYAIKIARDWNVPASGAGYVTRFEVKKEFLDTFKVEDAGGRAHQEYWIPAEQLPQFNEAIVGQIEIVGSFP
jgi:hypothetical protein